MTKTGQQKVTNPKIINCDTSPPPDPNYTYKLLGSTVYNSAMNTTGNIFDKTEALLINHLRPSAKVQEIIANIPEISDKFDQPDYVILDDKCRFNARLAEMNLIEKFAKPTVPQHFTDPLQEQNANDNILDHDYSTNLQPFCSVLDLRYFCNVCCSNTGNLFSFNYHMMGHTKRNDVVCQICLQSFLTTACLNSHINTHSVVCRDCGKVVPKVQLKSHQAVNINQRKYVINKYDRLNANEKIHFCVECMKQVDGARQLSCHATQHALQSRFKTIVKRSCVRNR